MFCSRCGTQIDESGSYCRNCGAKVVPPAAVSTVAGVGAVRVCAPGIVFAGFWKRFAARVIDSLILGAGCGAFAWVLFYGLSLVGFYFWSLGGTNGVPIAVLVAAILVVETFVIVAGWLYFTLLEASGRQGTVGKMALGIKVTDLSGARISFGRANGRFWSQVALSIFWPLLLAGYIMAGFTAKKQGLHDLMAETLVVNAVADGSASRATETR